MEAGIAQVEEQMISPKDLAPFNISRGGPVGIMCDMQMKLEASC